jgi:hypothetical protein
MRIGCSVNFKKDTLQVADYLAFFKTFVPFQPKRLSTDQGLERDVEGEAVESLIHKIFDQYFTISGNGGSILSGIEQDTRFIDLSIDPFNNTDEDILRFINRPGFISAYLYDSDYTSAQNSKIGKYIIDDSSLKDTPFFMSKDGYKVYDTSYNPGREELLSFTTLLPACKMWFGEGFFDFIPKEKVLTFPQAIEVVELPNGIVYIHLFENIADSNSPAARTAQWAWRNWLDFDRLVEKY